MITKVLMLKVIITVCIVAYYIHPILPTLGSIVWLWLDID